MDQVLAGELKRKLLQEKENITKQLERVTHESSFNKDKVQVKWEDLGDKDEDNAMEVADYQDNISLESNLERSLERIEKALKRMAEGAYGLCENCGQIIEEARLIAYPEAMLCLKCTVEKKDR